MAFAHVDDAVARLGMEAEPHRLAAPLDLERGPAAAVGRREVGGTDVRLGQALGGERGGDAVAQIDGIGFVVDMLELAAAAFGEVAARRPLAVRTRHEVAQGPDTIAGRRHRNVASALRHAVAAGGEADHRLAFYRHEAAAAGRWRRRSSAIRAGLASTAARAGSQTAAQAASNGSSPAARIAAITPVRTSPVPAVASVDGTAAMAARPSGAATTVSGPLKTITAPQAAAAARASATLLPSPPDQRRANSPACGVRIGTCGRASGGRRPAISTSASASR